MSKWISDAYIKRLLQNNRLLQGNCEYELWEQEAEKTVDAMPSIDIVRCAECIWRDKDNQGEDYCTYVKGLADITDDSFCSWGERNRR